MRIRSQRGVAFPSPVAILSVIAVAMAGIAFVATQGEPATEREVRPVAQPDEQPDEQASSPSEIRQRLPRGKPEKIRRQVVRGDVYVEVYNNSGITGLAGRYAGTASDVGWQVVGSDNWYGTVPGSTVYFPARLEAAGKQLALDLGIDRVLPAIDSMRLDRLTVVLTADAA